MEKVQDIAQAVISIARLMVDHPAEVVGVLTETSMGSVIQLRARRSDVGKLIGKGGRTAKTLRFLLPAMCATAGLQITLDIAQRE
jgi:predicted RNA-binding protein YlqC (UPF0109 family)